MTSNGWEPDALTAHVRICEGTNSIGHGSNIVTPHGKPVANGKHQLYPKHKRVRSTHPEPRAARLLHRNVIRRGPVNRVVIQTMPHFTYVATDDVGRRYFAVLHGNGCFDTFPWGSESFDCTIFAYDQNVTEHATAKIAHDLVRANTDWIATTGANAEKMHDIIDQTSVKIGRQHQIGDGSPMTSWHTDAMDSQAMAEVATTMPGISEVTLILIIGSKTDFACATRALKGRITKP